MLKVVENFTKTVDYLTQKVSMVILLVMTIGILSLSWSSNTYIKEMLSLRLKGAISAREQLSEIYTNFLNISIKAQSHKEKMYTYLNDLKIRTILLRGLIAEKNQEMINDQTDIINEITIMEKDIDLLREEFRSLNSQIEDALGLNEDNKVPK